MKEKRYLGSKIIVILLSVFLIPVSGLGLIVAGNKVKKKIWVIFGFAYIIGEWVFLMMNSCWMMLYTLVWIISIIHTAIICEEYGLLLNLKAQKRLEDAKIKNKPRTELRPANNNIEKFDKSSDNTSNNVMSSNKLIEFKDIDLGIGFASVVGESVENFTVKIRNKGKVYEFKSNGNDMDSFKVDGREYSYGG